MSGIQIFYIVFVILIGLLILAFVLWYPVKNVYCKNNFVKLYYKRVYKIALLNDYYLINNFGFNDEDGNKHTIDHFLFGDKFVYVIIDQYYHGDLAGKGQDGSLIFTPVNGKRQYISNPLGLISDYSRDIENLTNFENSSIIGIVLVNDDCNIAIMNESRQYFVTNRSKLATLVNDIEARDVTSLYEDQLSIKVNELARMNLNEKKGKRNER
ncbi:MAG: hypothetical protein LUC16_02795 [Coprobacillus sp.]|nr:hypothetical protein [Coprobacillus sp.]